MPSLLSELRRRNVFKVGAAYAIVGWLAIEVAATMLPIFGAPDWLLRVFSFFVLLGFPVALVLSWIYDLTPEGLERTDAEAQSGGARPASGSKLNVAIIGLLVVAVGYMFVDNYVLNAPRPPFAGAEVDPSSLNDESVAPPAAATVQPPPPLADEQPAAPLTAIAVLPFDNLSPDPNNAYFASGMHEEILNALAKLSALEVEARTSVLRYAENRPSIEEIAAELDVGSILEGSVRFADDRVRVTTQLIDASSGAHLWSETYEHEFDDIFAIESDVAMNIANAVEAEFTEEEQQDIYTPRTASPQALALVWQASEQFQVRDNLGAVPFLDRAIELDPGFSDAYALRAYARSASIGPLAINDPTALASLEALITEDVEQALSLDPESGFAYAAIATLHSRHRRSAEAQAAFERSYELQPNALGILWLYSGWSTRTGQFAQAIRLAEEALALDPTEPINLVFLANAQELAGELDRAADSLVTCPVPNDPAPRPCASRSDSRQRHRGARAPANSRAARTERTACSTGPAVAYLHIDRSHERCTENPRCYWRANRGGRQPTACPCANRTCLRTGRRGACSLKRTCSRRGPADGRR
jgi:TolB-like protein